LVKLRHIGDTLILTPTIMATRRTYPNARIDVVVRSGCEQILQGCPAIDNVYVVASPNKDNRSKYHWVQQLRQMLVFRAVRYDYAIEFTAGDRARLLIGFSGARHRVTNSFGHPVPWYLRPFIKDLVCFDFTKTHQVVSDFHLVKRSLALSEEDLGPLVYDAAHTQAANCLPPLSNCAVIHVTTRWKRKEWDFAKWQTVVNYLLEQCERVIVDVGPSEREMQVGLQLAGKMGERVICPPTSLKFSELAHLLYSAKIFVGLDSVSMHLAAACNTPMVVLFGPTSPDSWGPWQVDNYQIVQPGSCENHSNRYRDGLDIDNLPEIDIKQITEQQVVDACRKVLSRIHEEDSKCTPDHPTPFPEM